MEEDKRNARSKGRHARIAERPLHQWDSHQADDLVDDGTHRRALATLKQTSALRKLLEKVEVHLRRAPRRVAATRASGDVADASVASDARRSAFPRCVGTVTRTDSRGRRYEFYVVGTVHTSGCASAEEVREVIERVRPDAVVLELDQERLDITVANAMVATGRTEYGADLLAGATAAERLGALVVLGDAKARSLPELARARLLTSPADLADLPRLWRSLRYLGRLLSDRFSGCSFLVI